MIKTLLCTLVGIAVAFQLVAQQLPLLSQFQEAAGVLNPAAVHNNYFLFDHNARLSGTHHAQYTGIEGNPQTSQIVAEVILDDYEPMAPIAGVYLINDQTGPTGFTGVYGKFGGIISDDIYNRGLSFAVNVGINQYRLRVSDLALRDEEVIYAAEDDGRIYPDAGLGMYAYQRFGDQVVFVGASAPQVLGLDLSFRGNDGDIVTQRYRHYYGQAGAIVQLPQDSWLEPSVWVKYVPDLPVNVSATLRYQTPSVFFIGFGGSTAKAIHAETGLALGDRGSASSLMRIAYGIDYIFAGYGPYAGPTHEFNLSYSFNR